MQLEIVVTGHGAPEDIANGFPLREGDELVSVTNNVVTFELTRGLSPRQQAFLDSKEDIINEVFQF